jgi:hypothetical protein
VVTFTVNLPTALPTGAKIFKLGKRNIWYDITALVRLSSDRKSFSYDVENNSVFDRDVDFFGTSDPGGFRFIVDPIAIFAPEVPTLPPSTGGGGGGGCYVKPKVKQGSDIIPFIIIIVSFGIFVFLRVGRILKSYTLK